MRLDSGFYSKDIFNYFEQSQNPIKYITAIPMYCTIQRSIAQQKAWLYIEKGIDIVEFEYKAEDWTTFRRMIAVR